MNEQISTSTSKKSPLKKANLQQILITARAFLALILVVVVFSFLSPTFLTADNIQIMAKHVAINALLGIGMTFVILTGGIDLSVGSVAGLTARSPMRMGHPKSVNAGGTGN